MVGNTHFQAFATLELHIHKDELARSKPKKQTVVCQPRPRAVCQVKLETFRPWCAACCRRSSFLQKLEVNIIAGLLELCFINML